MQFLKAEGNEHVRMAFLDLMLDMLDKGEMDMEGIQEEVDTFTFEVFYKFFLIFKSNYND